jgi:hypothetical protein
MCVHYDPVALYSSFGGQLPKQWMIFGEGPIGVVDLNKVIVVSLRVRSAAGNVQDVIGTEGWIAGPYVVLVREL